MPFALSSGNPEAGSLSSFILYHLQRDVTPVEIRSLAKDRMAHVGMRGFNKLLAHWEDAIEYGHRFQNFSPNTPLSRLRIPSTGSECDMIRIAYEARIDSPGDGQTGERRTVGFTIDGPYEGTVGDAMQAARDFVRDWIKSNYAVRSARGGTGRVDVRVKRVECF
jgi:hypothetical protein